MSVNMMSMSMGMAISAQRLGQLTNSISVVLDHHLGGRWWRGRNSRRRCLFCLRRRHCQDGGGEETVCGHLLRRLLHPADGFDRLEVFQGILEFIIGNALLCARSRTKKKFNGRVRLYCGKQFAPKRLTINDRLFIDHLLAIIGQILEERFLLDTHQASVGVGGGGRDELRQFISNQPVRLDIWPQHGAIKVE